MGRATLIFLRKVAPRFACLPAAASADDSRGCVCLQDCVGFIMGRGGSVLRGIEEEWGTLMFFALVNGGKFSGQEKLAIFGDRRPRRASELKVRESTNGHFSCRQPTS